MTTSVRGMGTIAAKYWWVILVRGIILILLGMAMLIWPKQSLWVFAIIFVVYLFVDGIWALLAGISGIAGGLALRKHPGSGWGWFVTWGALALLFGIIVLFNPAALLVSLLWLVAIWAILAGIVF